MVTILDKKRKQINSEQPFAFDAYHADSEQSSPCYSYDIYDLPQDVLHDSHNNTLENML